MVATTTTITLQQNLLQVAEVEAEAAVVAEDKVLVGVPVAEEVPPGTTTKMLTATVSTGPKVQQRSWDTMSFTAHHARTSNHVQKLLNKWQFMSERGVVEMPT